MARQIKYIASLVTKKLVLNTSSNSIKKSKHWCSLRSTSYFLFERLYQKSEVELAELQKNVLNLWILYHTLHWTLASAIESKQKLHQFWAFSWVKINNDQNQSIGSVYVNMASKWAFDRFLLSKNENKIFMSWLILFFFIFTA